MAANIHALISQMQDAAEHVAHSSEELSASTEQSVEGTRMIAANIEQVAQLSSNQLRNLQNMSSVVETMSSDMTRAAETLGVASNAALDATQKATDGRQSIDNAIRQMERVEQTVEASAQIVVALGERSVEIGQIVGTIAGISSQTNLLALNAAIEAARAGEQGRGFAVVADEVKKLAGESQLAAEEIAKLIESIQGETTKAVAAMDEGRKEVHIGSDAVRGGGAVFARLADMSMKNSAQLQEITSSLHNLQDAAQTIVANSHDIKNASTQISFEAESVVAATEEQTASMDDVSQSSQQLSKIATDMHNATLKFTL